MGLLGVSTARGTTKLGRLTTDKFKAALDLMPRDLLSVSYLNLEQRSSATTTAWTPASTSTLPLGTPPRSLDLSKPTPLLPPLDSAGQSPDNVPMSIAFITTRELSKQPARVLARVKKLGPQIITVNGQPTAYLVGASPLGIEADIDILRALRLRQALAAAQAESLRAGTADLDLAAIDAEIAAARADRPAEKAKPPRPARKSTATGPSV